MQILFRLSSAPELRELPKKRREDLVAEVRRSAPNKGTRFLTGVALQMLPGFVLGFVWSYLGTSNPPPSWLPSFLSVGFVVVVLAWLAYPTILYLLIKPHLAKAVDSLRDDPTSRNETA